MKTESESPSLDERIRVARAERSVAMGYAIAGALTALWRVLFTLPFSPTASTSSRAPRRATTLLARFASHR